MPSVRSIAFSAPPSPSFSNRDQKLAALRRLIERVERRNASPVKEHPSGPAISGAGEGAGAIWSVGVPEIDAALPQRGLNAAAVHEVVGTACRPVAGAAGHAAGDILEHAAADMAVGSAYALALIKKLTDARPFRRSAPILWCQNLRSRQDYGAIHAGGLKTFGFHCDQFLFANVSHDRDVLWAMEESARAGNILAVIGEIKGATFTQTRRLSLAAAEGGTPVLLLRSPGAFEASAAETHWRIAPTPSLPDLFAAQAPGQPRWQIALMRCRGGRPGKWRVEWNNETHHFRLAEQFSSQLPQMADAPAGASPLRIASG